MSVDWKRAASQKLGDERGMGGGNIPFAPGAQQWKVNTEPPRHTPTPQGSFPGQGQGVSGGFPGQGQGAQGGQQGWANSNGEQLQDPNLAQQFSPYQIMQFARSLMDRYRIGTNQQARRYRG